jgi:hypothetical protein
MTKINIPGVSVLEFKDTLLKIIVKFKNLKFCQNNEILNFLILDLVSDVFSRNLSKGIVYYNDFLIEFTKNNTTIVFTIDPVDSSICKIKLEKQEKLDVLHGLEMLNQDFLKTKIVITREIYKELTFVESLWISLKEIYRKCFTP